MKAAINTNVEYNGRILTSPAIAAEGDSNDYRFLLKVCETNHMNSTLHIQRNFKKQGAWDGVPSGWHIGTLLNKPGYYGNNQVSDMIFIDGGQNWYVTGLCEAIKEVQEILASR